MEVYFISNFIGGLRNDVAVRMFKPMTVLHTKPNCSNCCYRPQQTNSYRPRLNSFQSKSTYNIGPKTQLNLPLQIHTNKPILSPKPISSYNLKSSYTTQNPPVVQRKPALLALPPISQNTSNVRRNSNSCFRCGDHYFPGY